MKQGSHACCRGNFQCATSLAKSFMYETIYYLMNSETWIHKNKFINESKSKNLCSGNEFMETNHILYCFIHWIRINHPGKRGLENTVGHCFICIFENSGNNDGQALFLRSVSSPPLPRAWQPKSPIILKNLVTIGKFNSFQLSIYSNSNGCCSLIVSLDLHKDLDKCLEWATLISKNDESFGWAALAFACSLNRRWKANLDWITLLRQYHQSSFNCILLTGNFALKSLGSDPAVSYWCFENSWCCWIKTPRSSP